MKSRIAIAATIFRSCSFLYPLFRTRRVMIFTRAKPFILSSARRPLDPTGGAELEVIAKEIMVQPPEVIARIKKLLAQ